MSTAAIRREASIKLNITSRQLSRHFDQSVDAMGLSRAKFGVIAAVARHPGVTQRMIAAYLEVTEVTAGRLIERLCADGHLERRPDPADRRAHCIYLTEQTKPLLDRLATTAQEHERVVFAGLEDAEIATLIDLLDRIVGNLATMKDAAPAIAPVKPARARKLRLEKATGG